MSSRTVTVTIRIADDITITIDEPIPYVPAEHADIEPVCSMCKIKPSTGTGRCEDRDCKRAKVRTLDEMRESLSRPLDVAWPPQDGA